MRNLRQSLVSYLLAVVATALALLVHLALTPWLFEKATFMFFLPAVLLAALWGGLRPGLLATLFSTIAMAYFLLPPENSLWVDGRDDRIRLTLFFIVGLGISVVCELLHAARRRAELNQQQLEREVEQRQQAEAVEREQRERLQVTLTSIGDAVIATDTQGQVTFLNGVAESLTGWTLPEAKGRLLEEVFCIINEKSRQSVEHPVAKVLREGRIVGLANHTILIAKDGGELPIDDSAAPIRDAQGVISGVVMVFRDITEQKQAEFARAERSRLTALRADISSALASHQEQRPALQQCTEAIVHHLNLVDVTEVAFARIWTLNQTENVLELQASAGCYTHLDGAHSRVKVGEFKIGRIAQSRQPHLTNDVPHDPNIGDPNWAAREGMVAFAGYPLLVEEQVYGVLALFARTTLSDGILKDLRPIADGIAQFINRKQVEESLRLSEHRYALVEQATNDGVWDWNPLTGEDYLSPRWKALLGFAEDELANKEDSFFSRIHPDDVATVTEAVRLHFEERLPYEVELRLRCKDDSYRWFLTRGEGLRDETGRVIRMVGSITDIAERKKAEAEIRRHKDQLTAFFENASLGLHWVDSEGIIKWANQAELELLGYSAEEYIGQPIAKFHADQNVIADILARLSRGEKLYEYEARLKCKDGSERIVSINSSVHSEEGRFIHTQCFTQDITERKQIELSLYEQTEVVETINRIGQTLSAALDLQKLVQALTDAATELTGAHFGSFFYNVANEQGESLLLYTLSGVPREAFAHFPMPRNTDIFGPTFRGEGVIRLADVKQDPRYGKNSPYYGMPAGHLPVASYLAVPVISRSGEVLGGLFFGHPEPSVFTERHERIIVGIAAQAAIALDNARLFELAQRERAEAKAAQKQVVNILESITDSFIAFDQDWRFTYLNGEAEALLLRLQIPGSEALGKNLWDMFPDLVDSEIYERFQHAVNEQVPVEYEFFYPPLSSWLDIRAYPSNEGLAVYAQDITARKQAEAKLVEQQAQFLTLAESIPQLAWMAGPDGYIHWYNRRWYEYTGTTPEQMEGWGWQSVHDPAVLPQVLERWQASIASGEPLDMVFPLRGADGVLRAFLTRVLPQRNQAGQVIQWFGTNTDIDDVKRAEAAVRQSEQRARFLAQASADFAEITDAKSTLQKVASIAVPAFADWCAVDLINPDGSLQRLAVKHTDPAKVRLAHELMERYPPHPDDPHGVPYVARSGKSEMMEEIPDELLAQSARDEEHLRIARALGLQSYICVPMQSKGKTLGVLTFVTAESGRRYDRDDLLAAEDLGRRAAIAIENANLYRTLQEADRRKDEFLATLAHELRNPLAPIRTGLHVLKLAQHNPVIAENTRTMMDRQLSHMVRLVDDLLDVSRITRGKLELRKERVELATVVQNAVEASRPLIDQQGHELIVKLPPVPVYLQADATRLAQVLQNLLNNAAKYSDKAGRIWLTAVQEGEEIVINVKDAGIGIPASHLPRIFDMFSQVDSALEKAQGGLGIGLSLVKGLVEMHSGSIVARSDGLGQGSEFVVRLPILVERKAAKPLLESSEEAAPPNGAQYRILVVDDNQDSMGWLAIMLEMMGNEVRTAHDGEAGIQAAAEFRPDIILMDIGMPKMNGYEAARHIRQESWGKHPFLVALTGWGAEEDRRRTQEAGFNRHLVKPVNPEEIEKLLAELANS